MKPKPSLIIACIAATSLLSACNRPTVSVGADATPSQVSTSPTGAPEDQKPIAGTFVEIECYAGPGTGYDPVGVLAPGHYYQVLATDSDVAIDDDVTWFQIDPTALIDPDPPHRPLAETSQQPEMRLRCWVLGSGVDLQGDLSGVPVVEMPVVQLLESAACRQGAAAEGDAEWALDQGAVFRVVGIGHGVIQIDDDVTWSQSDDDIARIQIDDDVTWFQIDPTALIDPNPPHRPLAESSQPPEMRRRCWVPGSGVDLRGDLSQVPDVPIPIGLFGLVDTRSRSSFEVEGVCSSALPWLPAVQVSQRRAFGDDPTVTVDGARFGLCHHPALDVLECLPLSGAAGSSHRVETCLPGEGCDSWAVTVPVCPEPSVTGVAAACSRILEGSPSVQVRGAPASIHDVWVRADGGPFWLCHAEELGMKECLPLAGEAGSTTMVTTCLPTEGCQRWPLTVPDCSAQVEVSPICHGRYPGVRITHTPPTAEMPRVFAIGGSVDCGFHTAPGVMEYVPVTADDGSSLTIRACYAGERCWDFPVTLLDCPEAEEPSGGDFVLAGVGCHDENSIFFTLDTRLPWLVPGAAFTYTASDGLSTYSCIAVKSVAGRLYCFGNRPGSPGALEVCVRQDRTLSPICRTFADWPALENTVASCVPTAEPTGLPACSSYGTPMTCPTDRCKWDGNIPPNGACVPR